MTCQNKNGIKNWPASTQASILAVLASDLRMWTAKEIAEKIQIDKSALHGMLVKLEEKGLARRSTSPSKAYWWTPTELGYRFGRIAATME